MFRYIADDVLPIYSREFHGPQEVKFVKNRIPEGFGAVLDNFCEELKKTNHLKKFSNMVDSGDYCAKKWSFRIIYDGDDLNMKECVKVILYSWVKEFLCHIDDMMVNKVSKETIKITENRCKIQGTVYNFTGKDIEASIKEVLALGNNFVLDIDNKTAGSIEKIHQELFNYLRKYRKYIHKAGNINVNKIEEWLEIANRDENPNCPHAKFYALVQENYQHLNLWKVKPVKNEVDFRKLIEEGVCVLDCDKKQGIALLNIKEVVSADNEMINQLGGVKTSGQNKKFVNNLIENAILEFEENLEIDARKYMNTYYRFRTEKIAESVLPFMKLTCKIHKLSSHELQIRDFTKLKYRPVIDCSRSALNYYSGALMSYVKSLTKKLEEKYFLKDSPLTNNGAEVAQILKSGQLMNNSGTFFAIADLSSAYSYIFLDNLLYAMDFAARDQEIPKWKSNLFKEIAILVLNNSFVQTSVGYYKFSNSLPMGLNCSGECLDLVCLVSEISFRGKVLFPEFSPCSERNENWTILDEGKMSTKIIKYLRYRDDTFTYGWGESADTVKNIIHSLGSAFLSTLDINVNLTHYVSSFLDCYFIKSITGNGFHTLIRRKGSVPVTFQHAESNSSYKSVAGVVSGEILRHRRICSNEDLIKTNDKCLEMELISRGYSKSLISKLIENRKNDISRDFSEEYIRIKPVSTPKGLVFGATTVYDSVWETHKIMKYFIKGLLQVDARLPSVTSGPKLRSMYYTKKRYLKMAHKYLKSKRN